MYHSGTGCVRSIKDCPTAYRLCLVPLHHSSPPYSYNKIERFWQENNIAFKRVCHMEIEYHNFLIWFSLVLYLLKLMKAQILQGYRI